MYERRKYREDGTEGKHLDLGGGGQCSVYHHKKLEQTALGQEKPDKLTSIVRLPSTVEQRWRELHALQDAVDRERVNPEPAPFYKYPVKMPLYAHQVRGANMAMLTFGWMAPKGGVAHG